MNAGHFLHREVEIIRLEPQSFLLYDAARDRKYRCGIRERWLVDRLDQNQERAQILEAFRETFGRRLRARELDAFAGQLDRLHLTKAPGGDRVPVPDPPLPPLPLSARDPGATVNHVFDWLVVLFGWILHPFWVIPLLALTWIEVVGFARNADLILGHLSMLFRDRFAYTIVLLFAVRAVVTLPREALLGMACRRYHGRIRHFGLHWWYRVLPYFLCQVTDPVKDERGRWTLMSIGLCYHLGLFIASGMAWMIAPHPSFLSDVLILSMVVGAFGFLMRLNPFEQLNLYGILCYHFKVNALLPRATAETRAWLFFRPRAEPLSPTERFWFRLYGLGVYLTRGVIVSVLGALLWFRFAGAGMVVLSVIVLLWHREISKQGDPRHHNWDPAELGLSQPS